MLTITNLMAAAKLGAGIPSNYRLARVLDLTESAVQRWNTGRGTPDDAQALRMAELAGLDAGYVLASVRAAREKDPVLRAAWEQVAERLLAQSGGAPVPPKPPTPSDDENGPDSGASGPGGGTLIGGIGRALGASEASSVRYVNSQTRQGRLIMASLVKALKKTRAH
jgi:hypothetical protein